MDRLKKAFKKPSGPPSPSKSSRKGLHERFSPSISSTETTSSCSDGGNALKRPLKTSDIHVILDITAENAAKLARNPHWHPLDDYNEFISDDEPWPPRKIEKPANQVDEFGRPFVIDSKLVDMFPHPPPTLDPKIRRRPGSPDRFAPPNDAFGDVRQAALLERVRLAEKDGALFINRKPTPSRHRSNSSASFSHPTRSAFPTLQTSGSTQPPKGSAYPPRTAYGTHHSNLSTKSLGPGLALPVKRAPELTTNNSIPSVRRAPYPPSARTPFVTYHSNLSTKSLGPGLALPTARAPELPTNNVTPSVKRPLPQPPSARTPYRTNHSNISTKSLGPGIVLPVRTVREHRPTICQNADASVHNSHEAQVSYEDNSFPIKVGPVPILPLNIKGGSQRKERIRQRSNPTPARSAHTEHEPFDLAALAANARAQAATIQGKGGPRPF